MVGGRAIDGQAVGRQAADGAAACGKAVDGPAAKLSVDGPAVGGTAIDGPMVGGKSNKLISIVYTKHDTLPVHALNGWTAFVDVVTW